MEDLIAIIVTILGSAIYAYLGSAHKKYKERKAAAQQTSTHIPEIPEVHATPRREHVAKTNAPTIYNLPEEGERVTTPASPILPDEPAKCAPTMDNTRSERARQLQRWRRAMIDREILTPKYH